MPGGVCATGLALKPAYLMLFIHLSIGPVTESSAVLGENTSETWL